ncbi:MAG: hypothetical protein QOE05_889 [Actinomycetota bacterium]|nr:hypothetical protein [Actinomycetota bacterium]
MHLPIVLGELHRGETLLASAYTHNATTHADEADIHHSCTTFAMQAGEHAEKLRPSIAKYGEVMPDQPDRLYAELFTGERRGSAGMLRDVRDLWLFASSVEMSWTLAYQAAKAHKDSDLLEVAKSSREQVIAQRKFLETKLKVAAPQALLVDPPATMAAKTVVRKKIVDGRAFTPGSGVYTFLASLVALAICGAVGKLFTQPMLFPSLGPILLVMLDKPLSPTGRVRNSLLANGAALLAGYGALALFGLLDHKNVVQEGITGPRIAAAALSLAVTGLVAHLLKAQHPPAGATTLIVSLGVLHRPQQLVAMAAAIVLCTFLAWAANGLAGVHAPLWSPRLQPELRPEG